MTKLRCQACGQVYRVDRELMPLCLRCGHTFFHTIDEPKTPWLITTHDWCLLRALHIDPEGFPL